jgi:nucleoid-associated protein YgaU
VPDFNINITGADAPTPLRSDVAVSAGASEDPRARVQQRVNAFIIHELTGRRRTLVLTGRALPQRPFTLAGEQGLTVTYYPGNPVASAQVLGARETETTVEGWWKDRFISPDLSRATGELLDNPPARLDNDAVGTAIHANGLPNVRALVAVVDDFRRQGQQVEVTWDELSRQGFIASFEQSWHNIHDVQFKIKFTWTSQSQDVDVPLSGAGGDLTDFIERQRALSDQLQTKVAPDPLTPDVPVPDVPVNASLLSQIRDATDAITSSVAEAARTVQHQIDGVLATAETLQRFTAINSFIAATAFRIMATTQSQVAAVGLNLPFTVTRTGTGLPTITRATDTPTVAQFAAYHSQSHGWRRTARDLRGEVVRQTNDVVNQTGNNQVLAVVVARSGQDLRAISTQFYGTPDQWRVLAAANHLASASLSPGQVIFVPRASNATR